MKHICIALLFVYLLFGCKTETDTRFLISKDQVGNISKHSSVSDITTMYPQDSLVTDTTANGFGKKSRKVKIYEKGGTHLLTLALASDSLQKIESIRVFDPRFVTEKGVGLQSTFKQIKEAYEIRKIVTSMNNVVLFLKDTDVYFTISKEELPASLRYAVNTKIEAVQIPDKAKVKYMMVGWE